MSEQIALIAPIDLGLGAGHHLETAVQTGQRLSSASAISAAIRGLAPAGNILTR